MATAPGNSALIDLERVLQRAREIAQRAANPDLTADAHASLNIELEALRGDLHAAVASVPSEPAVDTAAEGGLVSDTSTPAPRAMTAKGRHEFIRYVLGAVLVLVIAFALGMTFAIGTRLWKARQVAVQSTERFSDLRQALGESPFAPESLASLDHACEQAGELERDLAPLTDLASTVGPASQLLGQLPQVGERATATLTLVQAAGEISTAARVSCEALQPIADAIAGAGDTPTVVASFVAQLAEREDELRAVGHRLAATWAQLDALDEAMLDDTSRRTLRLLRDKLPSAASRLSLLAEAPTLLGVHGPRTYLVLGQNSDELRPTGGFIGTMGLLTFDQGRLIHSEYGSSFALALPNDVRVPPPAALARHMSAQYWQFWESNWWPDFPSSALQADYFFGEQRQAEVDGVVAVDQDVIRRLLKVTGPVRVGEFGETVDAGNVQERLEYHVHEANYPDPVRKTFVTALFAAVVEQLTHLSRDRVGDLSGTLYDGFQEQRLQMWSRDDRVQQALSALDWDGRLIATESDYLYLVSANLSANKVNREVEQSLAYSISQVPGERARAEVTIQLQNTRKTDDPGPYRTADYRDYLRLYVPHDAELIGATGLDSPAETLSECGMTAFAGLIVVKPGQERRIEISYMLPPWIGAHDYSLTVQKQPGVRSYRIAVEAQGAIQGSANDTLEGTRIVRPGETGLVMEPPRRTAGLAASRLPRCAVHETPPTRLAGPSALMIPRLGVDAGFVELGVDEKGALEAPTTGDVVAWYSQGARPGQGGNMVVSGHLDWDRGPAVFSRLGELRPGDQVIVDDADGVAHEYEVRWTQHFDAKEAPLNRILGPTSERWLTMITCGGLFDRATREYRDRVVVRAELVS